MQGIVMNIGKIGLMGALAALLALPAVAQTTQTSPAKPTPSMPAPSPATTPSPAATLSPAKPAPLATVPSATTGSRPMASTNATLVDVNTASPEDLDKLPGIGKARADAIVKNRPYKGKDDLLNRHIIPPNVYNGIKDKIVAKQG